MPGGLLVTGAVCRHAFFQGPDNILDRLFGLFAQAGIRTHRLTCRPFQNLFVTVRNIHAAIKHLETQGARVLGDGKPRTGAHGLPVVFLHPKDFCGTLVELEEVA